MSGAIYAMIVVMWALVLVPMLLRRHDAASAGRSMERFSSAMRVLSRRRPPAPDRRYVVRPSGELPLSGRPRSAPVIADAEPDDEPVPVPARRVRAVRLGRLLRRRTALRQARPARPAAPARSSREVMMARRRRVLGVLLASVLLSAVLVAASVVPWWLNLLADVALVGYLIVLRSGAKQAAAAARQRRRVPVAPSSQPVYEETSWDEMWDRMARPMAVGDLASDGSYDASPEGAGTDDESLWEPVPVPPPTYTMKATAPPRSAPIDFDDLDDEDEGFTETVATSRPDTSWEEDTEEMAELNALLERRRAVGD